MLYYTNISTVTAKKRGDKMKTILESEYKREFDMLLSLLSDNKTIEYRLLQELREIKDLQFIEKRMINFESAMETIASIRDRDA